MTLACPFCSGDIIDFVLYQFPTLVGEPKFHSWGRWTMALTNTHSDGMPIAFSGLSPVLTLN